MTTHTPDLDLGAFLRSAHHHAWRADAPPLELELGTVAALLPNLVKSASVGLVWPRMRHRADAYGAAGLALERAYQSQVAHNANVECEIARVVGHLREANIEAVLIKGWAVSRLYPEGLVRTAGDIDLVVRDADYDAAMRRLAGTRLSLHGDSRRAMPSPSDDSVTSSVGIDLHSLTRWGEAPADGFFERAQAVPAGDTDVLVPCVEDHLHALCVHFLRHAATRPLRLCDIALLLETRPAGFDWERCLSGSRRQIEQVSVTLGLAHKLLGARIDDTPVAKRETELPGWLVSAVLQQWRLAPSVPGPVLPELLANPRGIVTTCTKRWPDPITATLRTHMPFNHAPRLPIQWAAFLRQIAYYGVRTLPRQASRLRQ